MLQISHLSADYGGKPALADINLTLDSGELLVVLGPSGCGKTTLLNLIAGFVPYQHGSITLEGRRVEGPGADRGVVFQNEGLLPWRNVQDNVALGLQLAGVDKTQRRATAARMLKKVGLEGAEKRFIWQLSGGQRQRVGIARALAANPQLLLLDEPFGALDAFTREQMQTLLLSLWHETGKKVLLITHDIEEAVFMATELILLSPGPGRVLERLPLNFGRRFVAGESCRSIKSDPRFIEQREYVLSRVFEGFLMSVVINDKPRQRRLKWRWPFSRQLTLSAATLAVLLAIWWAVAALQLISPLFLPPPGQVLQKLITIAGPQGFMDATLWQHLAASLTRIVIALLAAVLLGVPVGIAMGLSPTVRGILDPLIELYRPVPPLAYLPLMVIWFGIGETSKILLIYLAIFAPVAMSALAGVKSAQQVRIRAAQSLGASRAQVLWLVILPGALPEILTGLRIGLGVGWSTLVAAELIAATRGLGFMVQSAGEFLATDVVLAGIAVIAIIAFLLELGLRALQRRLTPWHGEVQ